MCGDDMKINLYGVEYIITSTTIVDGVLNLLLQDSNHKMYRKDIFSILSYLYEMKAKSLLNIPTLDEYQQKIQSLSTALNDDEVYHYLNSIVPNLSIPQDKFMELYKKWINGYKSLHKNELSTDNTVETKQSIVEKTIIENKTVEKTNTKETVSTEKDGISVERKNELNSKTVDELMFLIQMHPSSEENDFIRELIEIKQKQVSQDYTRFNYMPEGNHNSSDDNILLKSQRNQFMGGFASETLIIFLVGMIVGICSVVIFNWILRLL